LRSRGAVGEHFFESTESRRCSLDPSISISIQGEGGVDYRTEIYGLLRKIDETFVAYYGGILGYAASAVRVIPLSVRREHLMNRSRNPLARALLVEQALKELKRLQGGSRRKIPATAPLVRHAIPLLELDTWDGLITALALVFMFLFLLRSREALRKGASPDPQQCARKGYT
jgi:hypothetical protein